MKPTIFDFACGGIALLSLQACKTPQQDVSAQYPNVIYIFPDQMRNSAMGFWNEPGFSDKVNFKADPVYTPNLNRFAAESLVLSSAQSNCPLSSPHRGMLLTGMYPNKSGVSLNCNSSRPFSSLRDDVEGVGDVFHNSGYDCAYFGKLHTDFPTPNDPERPGQYVEERRPAWDAYTPKEKRHGFNYWYSYGTYDVHKQPHYWDTDGIRHEIDEWSPKHEAEKIISYLKNDAMQRDPKKPFLIMVGMNPPHSPYNSLEDCMEEDYLHYKDMPVDSLLLRPNADKTMGKAKASARFYFSSVTGVDRQFGRILDTLKDLGLDKNTIVVFSSDHGETMCSQGTNDPKNSPYSESMNVPFIIRYPDRIKPRVDNLLMSSPDIMPTLIGLCGLSDSIPQTVQGQDFSALFYDENAKVVRPDATLYIRNEDGDKDKNGLVQSYFPSSRGIKTARYTLAFFIDKKTKELTKTLFFDDVKDPYQMNNLSLDDNKETVEELCKKMASTLKRIDDPWYENKYLSEMMPY